MLGVVASTLCMLCFGLFKIAYELPDKLELPIARTQRTKTNEKLWTAFSEKRSKAQVLAIARLKRAKIYAGLAPAPPTPSHAVEIIVGAY